MRKLRWLIECLLWKEIYITKTIQLPLSRLWNDGWDWCLYTDVLNKDSIIYSIWVGNDISFDIELIDLIGCKVYAFDPTPKSLERLKNQALPDNFIIHPWWLADYNGTANFYSPKNNHHVSHTLIQSSTFTSNSFSVDVQTLSNSMKRLGHEHIDVLKIDIEWAEYAVIEDMLASKILPQQLLVEIHHRFENIDIQDTRNLNKSLWDVWYKLAYVSHTWQEYTWIREVDL